MDRESAMKDFEARLSHYEKEYEEISDKCEMERYLLDVFLFYMLIIK